MLKELGLAGLLLLSPITTKADDFESQYGKMLYIQPSENHLCLGYDTDGDNMEDLRLVYEIIGGDNGFVYLQLIEKWIDKNRDGFFADDELEIIKEKENEIIENIVRK